MFGCFALLKLMIEEMCRRLFQEFPGEISIGFIAHGDYCDEGTSYITKTQPFTTNVEQLVQFVKSTQAAGGGDAKECYELALHLATEFDWGKDDALKIMLVVGDERPHEVGYRFGRHYNTLDWKVEAKVLARQDVRIDGVQCLNRRESNSFYRELTEIGGGHHFKLDQFGEITDLILGVCYQGYGQDEFQQFAQQVEDRGRMNRATASNFQSLGATTKNSSRYFAKSKLPGLQPVEAGRFQIFPSTERISIKDFASHHSLTFEPGKLFYEWTKPEDIREENEVVLLDSVTGDIFTGDEARNKTGIPFGSRSPGKIKPVKIDGFRIFIQSTSHSRKTDPNTEILYEVNLTS